MERIERYKPNVLKNEVNVSPSRIKRLFETTPVFVFGYGSLLYSNGWRGRGMSHRPMPSNLTECVLNGFLRGPFATFGWVNFYGIVEDPAQKVNGVLARIHTADDWLELMSTEMVAGLSKLATYRVVNVTKSITDIKGHMPKKYIVHAVCNRPSGIMDYDGSRPAPFYYGEVWRGVQRERSEEFIKTFLKTGGIEKHTPGIAIKTRALVKRALNRVRKTAGRGRAT